MGTQLPSQKWGRPPIFGPCLLWPNGWMDEARTWHGVRPEPMRLCVRWGPSPYPKRGWSPLAQFLAHFYCGQTAGWIKMALGMEVGLGEVHIALDVDTAPLPKKWGRPPIFGPCLFWPNGWMDEAGTWHGGRPEPMRLCVRWGPSPYPKRGGAPFPNFWPMSIVAKRLDASRCHLVWM